MKAKWRIRKYDGNNEIGRWEEPHHFFGSNQIEELLKRLASRYLTEEEIIQSSLNRRAKDNPRLLNIRNSKGVLTCGEGIRFIIEYIKTSD